jgi:hypothetical protein
MSRTRHHNKLHQTTKSKQKKLSSYRQRYIDELRTDEWYIELPASNQFKTMKLSSFGR